MNDETFNLSVRKFLKQFGIAAQREIEKAVAAGLAGGGLKGNESLHATATIRVEDLHLEATIEGSIVLE